MSNLKDKYINIQEFKTSYEFENIICNDNSYSKFKDIEIFEIEDLNSIDTTKQNSRPLFMMPNYVTYYLKTQDEDIIISNLKKNKKKKIKKIKKELEENPNYSIIVQSPISKETFNEWFELYKQNLNAKDKGILLLKNDWWEKELDNCEKMGIFIVKHEGSKQRIKGGILGRSFKEDSHFAKRFSISYSTFESQDLPSGISEYINLKYISEVKALGYEHLFRGKDTNIYGKHLSSGIPIFKCSLGFTIIAYTKEQDMAISFNNLNAFTFPLFFMSYKNNSIGSKLIGNCITHNDCSKNTKSTKEFNFPFLEELHEYSYNPNDKTITCIKKSFKKNNSH